MNTAQESIQTVGCSTSKLHKKDKAGFGERAMQAEAAAEKRASPMVSSTSRDVHREFRDEWGFTPSPELQAPEVLHWTQSSGSSTDRTRHTGALPMRGPARSNQVLPRSSSSPHSTYSNPDTALSRRDNKVLGCSQLKVNNHLLLSKLRYMFPDAPHRQQPSSKEQS